MNLSTKILIYLCDARHFISAVVLVIGTSLSNSFYLDGLKSERLLNKEYKSTWGILDHKWYTGQSDQYAYDFSFVLPDLGEYKGTSYNYFDKFNLGDSVRIEYYPPNPNYARIIKMKAVEQSRWIWYGSLLMILAGIGFSLWALWKRYCLIKMCKPNCLIPIQFKGSRLVQWLIYPPIDRERYDFFKVVSFQIPSKKETQDVWAWMYQKRIEKQNQFGLINENGWFFPLNLLPKFLAESIIKQLKKEA